MEPDREAELVLRCSVCAYPQVWTWVVTGPDAADQVARHDPGVDIKVEVLAGVVEVTIDGRVRTYRAGESVIFPPFVSRALRAVREPA